LTFLAEFDTQKWSRKVFKIFKSLQKTEKKILNSPLTENQFLMSKRVLKLVVVLYNLNHGMEHS
jgi:hypothetical protein